MLIGVVHTDAQRQYGSHGQFVLKVTPGTGYSTSTTLLVLFRIPLYPQIACWLETRDGEYISTIYVTSKSATKNFFAAPAAGRPEALPVWNHLLAQQVQVPDAVSGATASTGGEHRTSIRTPLRPGSYVVMLEVNRSYDYNAHYTRTASGVNGQPSLIYRGEIAVGEKPSKALLVPIGTGSVDGSDGSVASGLDDVTTALTIIERAEVSYEGN